MLNFLLNVNQLKQICLFVEIHTHIIDSINIYFNAEE